jgi:hypothetical protein
MTKQCFNVIERNAYNGRIVNVTCNLTEEEAQSLAREIVDAMVEHDVQHSAHYVSEERLAELEDNARDCVEVVNDRRHASWVVVKNDTGEALGEIDNAERVSKISKKLNRDVYSLVPIYEYLTKLNARIARGEA